MFKVRRIKTIKPFEPGGQKGFLEATEVRFFNPAAEKLE